MLRLTCCTCGISVLSYGLLLSLLLFFASMMNLIWVVVIVLFILEETAFLSGEVISRGMGDVCARVLIND